MAEFKSSSFLALIWIFHLASASDSQREQTARSGDDIILNCRGPNDVPIIMLQWTRTDLKSPEYVFLYRDEQSDTTYQNPSFVDRVELLDREMKNGDLSLTIKNVGRNDAGTYECHFSTESTKRSKRANLDTEPSCIILLKVETGLLPQFSRSGSVGFSGAMGEIAAIIGGSLIVCVIVLGFIYFLFKKYEKNIWKLWGNLKNKLSATIYQAPPY